MSRALEGLIVLDRTGSFWASLGVALLGDFGAQVLRIEDPAAPAGTSDAAAPRPAPWDWESELAQRNKRSLVVDERRPEGRAIVEALVARADVVAIDRPLPEVLASGWDYETLVKLRPDVIYARGTGFGPKGPDRELPALDELAAARAGMMPLLPQPGQPPVYPGHGSMYTAVMLALGVLAALEHRAESGEGQIVDVSLLAGNMYGASLDLQAYLAIGGERLLAPVSRLDMGNPMSGTMYPASDGKWVTLTMPDTGRWWPAFAPLVGIDPGDPRFDSHEKRCEHNRLELMQELERAFGTRTAAQWRAAFDEHQLSADVIEDYSYPENDPSAYRNRYLLDLPHPSLGRLKLLGFPIFLSDGTPGLDRLAACAGQHTGEVLHDWLGIDEDRITELRSQGVVG
ncbi:CoA transferase [Myxococcota bacterium]|nr:CoA transferase [Myxococcota bacterium]